jgi:tRNA pseudouridine38-40 synthase
MASYKSIVAYDGTEFHGFQRQAEGRRTVQAALENALRDLGWREKSIKAAGRTDAGVHAQGQVVSYSLAWNHGPERLTRALNARLPEDLAVRRTELAPEGFHPRFSARRRRYRYTLIPCPVRDPLRERYAWRVWPEPDVKAMGKVAQALVGRRDFAAFGRAPISGGHTVRQVFEAGWSREADRLTFEVEADAFLNHMVRRLVAASWQVGMGRLRRRDVLSLLDDPSRRWEGRIAPARGLCLQAVIYA